MIPNARSRSKCLLQAASLGDRSQADSGIVTARSFPSDASRAPVRPSSQPPASPSRLRLSRLPYQVPHRATLADSIAASKDRLSPPLNVAHPRFEHHSRRLELNLRIPAR